MKKLVLCSDGTGNSSAKAQKTNVWRIFQALDQTTPDQLAMYDDGVGTSSVRFLAAIGGAFGYGLKRNVIDLYKFVCRTYQDGDEIHGFGFSRGAFTIRVVVALIESQGLVEGRSESELHAHALVAYRRYRAARYPSWSPLVWVGRRLRDAVLRSSTAAAGKHIDALPAWRREVPIRFLGLWDTVAAYGMPVDELKWGISLLIWPMVPIDHHLDVHVKRACHALSLDEQRQTFHPILFDEVHEARLVAAGKVDPGRLTQVWFAGVHSNVGGGYPEDRQSLVALDWMISQATDAGLRLDAGVAAKVAEDKSAFARLYDSRHGLAAYYRYAPRSVDMGRDGEAPPVRAIVHGSVVMRMAAGSDAYAPITLPGAFDVLAPDGSLIPMEGFAAGEPARALVLPPSTTATAKIPARTADLKAAIMKLGVPEPHLVEQIRDTVWWRRVTYFACLFFTLTLVAFPWAATRYAILVDGAVGWVDSGLARDARAGSAWFDDFLRGIVLPWMDALKSLAPPWAASWVRELGERPFEMLVALLLVALPFQAGVFLAQRIHDRSWFAWHADRRQDYIDWVRASVRSSAVKAAVLFAAALMLVVLAGRLHWPAELSVLMRLLAVALLAVLLWRLRIVQHLGKVTADDVPTTPTLQLARMLRNSRCVQIIVDLFACRVVPLAFALALLWGIAGVASHFVARAADSAGAFCVASQAPAEVGPEPVTSKARFDAKSMCFATGIKVEKGVDYEIVLDASGSAPWFDRHSAASLAGVPKTSLAHALALPIKRSWSVDYFVPILRQGRLGNYELPVLRAASAPGGGVATLKFTAAHTDELFIYLSDAVAIIPGHAGYFYDNNCGWTRVTVARAASGALAASGGGATPAGRTAEKCPAERS